MSVTMQQSSLPPELVELQQALHDLHPTHRRVLALRFLQHRSTAQIALTLRCTEANVKVLQHHALLELQRITMYPPVNPQPRRYPSPKL